MDIINFFMYLFKNEKEEEKEEEKDEKKNEKNDNKVYEDEMGKYTLLDFKFPDDFFCPICINTLHEDKNVFLGKEYIKFDCSHTIHYKCLYEYNILYKKNKCPLCNSLLNIENECFDSYCKVTRTWDEDPEKQKCRRRYIK